MVKAKDILGMNARNQLFTSLNSKLARGYCSSKYATKILLENKQIPTAKIFGILLTTEDINDFPWFEQEKNIVIKPINGNAGKGVVAFRKQSPDGQHWIDVIGRKWDLDDIKLHCMDILEGQYSTYGSNNAVIVEERIPIHTKLMKYTYKGTPDIRVIVFNKVPVMALLRLPTKESEGRANQTQGAIGVGIDMATGITTYAAAHKNRLIQFLPGTKYKLNGIKIPFWKKLLETAVLAVEAAGLMYGGADLFVHEEKGPMVVELNANPGLSIQIANQAGLKRRLERVSDLNVLNAEHGVRIGQALFAETFADKVIAEDGLKIISTKEEIYVYDEEKNKHKALALINTGRYRSAIAGDYAKELGLIDVEDLLWYQHEKEEDKVPVIEVSFRLKDRKIRTAMVASSKLNKSKHKLEIGRRDLAGFLVGEQPS